MNYIAAHAGRIGSLTLAHVAIVATALAVASAIAIPTGIYAARFQRTGAYILGTLGAIYTIPSLALLAILVSAFGLGNVPIFIALVAYAQFVLVRNVETALRNVDPAAVDAARGLGMSATQILTRVEIPLALPVIVGGMRIATISMIAIATLGGYVGGTGLGSLIFSGLTLHHNDMIVAGSVATSVLAVAADLTFRLTERLTTPA